MGLRDVALVAAGGVVGTAAREALALGVPAAGGVPWAILVANLSGALLLGLLVGALAARGPETAGHRRVRLALGTGVLGGYTTYSALAADTAGLLGTDPALAVAYGLGSVVLGVALAAAGLLVGHRVGRSRAADDGEEEW